MATTATDIYLGYGSIIGLGLETTYGTAVTPTSHMVIVSGKATQDRPQVPRPHLHYGTGRVASGYYPSKNDVTVNIEVELGYDGIGMLLRAACGPAPITTGAGPYVHPQLLGNTLPSLTIRVYRGSATGSLTGRYDEVTGCVCNSMKITSSAEDTPRLVLEFFGQAVTRANQATPTVILPTPVLYHQVADFSWNSATYDGNSLELSVDNGLARRRNLQSLDTAYPHPSALRNVSLTIARDHVDEDFMTALAAETESDFVATWTGGGSDEFKMTLHSARVVSPADVGPSSGGFGALAESIEFLSRYVPGSTNYGLVLQRTNGAASYLT